MFPSLQIGELLMLALWEQPAHACDQVPLDVRRFDQIRRRIGPPSGKGGGAQLRALAGDALAARFRSWAGASGERYVFSVYDRQSCPAYEHAVLIVAAVDKDEERRIIFVADTGCFPELAFANAAQEIPTDREIEFHVHLLATSRAERATVVADLSATPKLQR
jgi:hypothetical protein